MKYASATVDGSVYTAANKRGIPRVVVAQLATIFSHKANFSKMQKGDRFAVLYKVHSVNGKKIKDGEVIAAELLHKKNLHRMIGFENSKGGIHYYTPEGYNTKPPFMRCPLAKYTRIGSKFSLNRRHPILLFSRPHLGVDFTAPRGTPIMAACSGRIGYVGYKNGYGRTVEIKRGPYKTRYAHLSRYSNIQAGDHVNQGQIIGYVGSSGLATGPHLHYEFCINGVHHDPLKVNLPVGEKIDARYRQKFFATSKKMLAQLDLYNNRYKILAMNDFVTPEPQNT